MLLNLGRSWMDLMNPKLLLGARGKGEVEKGGRRGPQHSCVLCCGFGRRRCFLLGEDAWQTLEFTLLPLQLMRWGVEKVKLD